MSAQSFAIGGASHRFDVGTKNNDHVQITTATSIFLFLVSNRLNVFWRWLKRLAAGLTKTRFSLELLCGALDITATNIVEWLCFLSVSTQPKNHVVYTTQHLGANICLVRLHPSVCLMRSLEVASTLRGMQRGMKHGFHMLFSHGISLACHW